MTDILLPEFQAFPKIGRRNRVVVITEKIDGTNGIVHVSESGVVTVGSRTRWITPEKDNAGFARWVADNVDDLRTLGPGYHYGEWWGLGIQRRYDMTEKRFSLFNVGRWSESSVRPKCCHVVPVILTGFEKDGVVDRALSMLVQNGSFAAPGFMKPEGIVVYHTATKSLQKITIEKDEEPKGKKAAE